MINIRKHFGGSTYEKKAFQHQHCHFTHYIDCISSSSHLYAGQA